MLDLLTVRRPVRLATLLAFFVTVLALTSSPGHAADKYFQISIKGISLRPGQLLAGILLDTVNLRIVAICHIPPGWGLMADSPPDATAQIVGGADFTIAALEQRDEYQLHAIALVTLDDGPTRITGKVKIVRPGPQLVETDRPLTPANIVMEPAAECAPPGSWKRR